MASRNTTTHEIYPAFSDCAIWHFLFQRQFYQPDESQQQFPHQEHVEAVIQRCFVDLHFFIEHLRWLLSKHEIQAPTLIAGREQEEEFRGSPDNENTNEEKENSTKQTNNKSP